jgi:hypothetical protein
MMEMKEGPMNGPHKEAKPELRFDVTTTRSAALTTVPRRAQGAARS